MDIKSRTERNMQEMLLFGSVVLMCLQLFGAHSKIYSRSGILYDDRRIMCFHWLSGLPLVCTGKFKEKSDTVQSLLLWPFCGSRCVQNVAQ